MKFKGTVLLVFLVLILICTGYMGYKPLLSLPESDADNGGLLLPEGFQAVVVAGSTGRARHIAINSNGDIYVKIRSSRPDQPGNIALRDTNNDGKADQIEKFGIYPNTGSHAVAAKKHCGIIQ